MNFEQLAMAARTYRELLLSDPYRPNYHFCVPDGDGDPGDPNGYFFADGRHHLMYLYRREGNTYYWAHSSSTDLIHWRQHTDCLVTCDKYMGCFSGGAFVDEDGTAYISYWLFTEGMEDTIHGIGLAKSVPPYEDWEQLYPPVITCNRFGYDYKAEGIHIGCADPSNIWKKDGIYYMQAGNKIVLDDFGREADSPRIYQGDWTELFSSEDLLNWRYVGRFYEPMKEGGPDLTEDDMCPVFLPLPASRNGGPLTDKYLQLFISHNHGCQYYIGTLEGKNFVIESHGRMSWVDDTFFAPEAALDDNNRMTMFAWLRDNLPEQFQKYGWSGVYGLPRVLWLREDGALGITPADELKQLRYQETDHLKNSGAAGASGHYTLTDPTCCEIKLAVKAGTSPVSLSVMNRADGSRVIISYDPQEHNLYVDARESSSILRPVLETAPLQLGEDEALELTVYLDKSVIEVFANDRQAITRRVYNPAPVLPEFVLETEEAPTELKSWVLDPANPY